MKITKDYLRKLIREGLEEVEIRNPEDDKMALDDFLHNLYVYGPANQLDDRQAYNVLHGALMMLEDEKGIAKTVLNVLQKGFKAKEGGAMRRAGYK